VFFCVVSCWESIIAHRWWDFNAYLVEKRWVSWVFLRKCALFRRNLRKMLTYCCDIPYIIVYCCCLLLYNIQGPSYIINQYQIRGYCCIFILYFIGIFQFLNYFVILAKVFSTLFTYLKKYMLNNLFINCRLYFDTWYSDIKRNMTV